MSTSSCVAITSSPGSSARAVDGPTSLMTRIAAGDQEAFGQFHDQFVSRVLGVVRSVVRDPSQSEEVAQEVFVEAWRTATRFDHTRGRVETWLFTMARRRAIDRVRSEQASRRRLDRVGRRHHVTAHDVVSEDVITQFEHRDLRRAMATLTAKQREAILLAWFQGLTYREVAERLDVPLGTIKTRMRDGLIRLRTALDEG